MNNKRINHFLFFTEQNIIRDPEVVLTKDKAISRLNKKLSINLSFIIFCLFLLFLFLVNNQKRNDVITLSPMKESVIKQEQYRPSQLPNYQVAASRQFLRNFPLHKLEIVQLDESDIDQNKNLQLVDKVIVMPKRFA